uniref:non-specific serine/threonine protein kinase n=1 Tax=Leersia perrieri TaxID=77586 RepID=A0A0D9VGK9_9ORYZ
MEAVRCFVTMCVATVVVALACSGGVAVDAAAAAAAAQELRRGFTAAHDRSSSQFEAVLSDPSGVFALGFLRVNSTMLDLAVLHLPSSFPLWRAIPDRPAQWGAPASLSFDGDLLLTDPASNKVTWSAAAAGDRVVLLNTSNLQIQTAASASSVVWQSFDTPSDTIVQGQNLTSAAALRTSDRRFAMRMGTNYFGLYIDPPLSSSSGVAAAMYWKHTALQAKAEIVAGGGATYARVEPDGYLAMYQKEGPPADVLSFDTFNHGVRSLRRMTLETDGNLRAYYYDNPQSRWVLDFTAITDPCSLPTTCGAYAVCVPPTGRCACLANATDGSGCAAAVAAAGGLCGRTGGEVGGLYWEVRRNRVEPANKELLPFENSPSAADCEARCARNCSCWGSVYSNGTGYCYFMDYPAQMMVEADERKVGYFKVRSLENPASGGGGGKAAGVKVALLVVGVTVVVVAAAFGAYRVWKRRCRTAAGDVRGQVGVDDERLSPGPYKNLGSFSSVELSSSFRR